MDKMEQLDKHIYKYLDREINFRGVNYARNSRAIYLTPELKKPSKNFTRMVKNLPKEFGHFINIDGEHIFGVNETPQEQLDFAEVCASAAGEVLLAHQQETLIKLKAYSETLKNMKAIKEEHDLEYSHNNP